MNDPDLSPLRRRVRCVGVLVWLAALASGGGLAFSLSRPDVGPSLRELGWQRTPTRKPPPEPLDHNPRVRVQFDEGERFCLFRLSSPNGRDAKPVSPAPT